MRIGKVVQYDAMRKLAGFVFALALAGCSADGGAPPSTSPPPLPTPIESSVVTPTEAPSPSPAACATFGLVNASMPGIVLHLATQPDRNEVLGLNGSAVLGSERFDRGDWHQSAPRSAIEVTRAEGLLVSTYPLDQGELPLCIASATIDAAPFSPIGASPAASALVPLGATDTLIADLSAFPFLAPSQPGEYIVRVVLTFATDPGPSSQETFFRLRVDTPALVVGGSATAPVACGGLSAHPPKAFLSVDSGSPIVGEGGPFTWGTTAGDGPAPPGTRVEIEHGAALTLQIEDDLCAAWWSVQLAAPAGPYQGPEAFLDVVPAHPGYGDPGKASRFRLDTLPTGNWVVAAGFEFVNSKGDPYGQTTNFWNVVVR